MKNFGANKILKIHKSLAYMEQSKYMNPKLSYSFEELAGILRNRVSSTDTTFMSNISSINSFTKKSQRSSKKSRIHNKFRQEINYTTIRKSQVSFNLDSARSRNQSNKVSIFG